MYRIILGIVIVISIAAVYLRINRKISADETVPSASSTITEKVTIENNRFIPTLTTINLGDKVVISNNDTFTHQIISDTSLTQADYSPLDIGPLNSGESKSVSFTKRGAFGFHDQLHPEISGQVVVE